MRMRLFLGVLLVGLIGNGTVRADGPCSSRWWPFRDGAGIHQLVRCWCPDAYCPKKLPPAPCGPCCWLPDDYRLFRVLKDSEAKISRCRWKLVDSEHTRLTTFPDEWTRQAVCVEWDYDWIPWKHIEWVEFETSDAARAQEVLNGHGKFDMQRIEQRLRGYGYRG